MRIAKLTNFNRLLILGWIASLFGCNAAKNEYAPPPPLEVTVAQPVQQSMTPLLEQNGVIEAVDEAEVRARVRGLVESVQFDPWHQVAEGDVLYQIEADQYQAAVNSAKATVDASEAAIAVAKALVKTAEAETKRADQNLTREKSLMQQGAGSQSQLDAAMAANDAAMAALESAQANVEAAIAEKASRVASLAQAQLDLDYTTVQSPISGRISTTDVKQGNLVESGTKLAQIVNRNFVFANFSVSDREMLRFMKEKERTAALNADENLTAADWSNTKAFLKRESDEGFPFEGVLDYVAPEGIDATTGTLRLRAKFENSDGRLIPGLFVTVRIPTGDAVEAMLIPEYAVLRDQRGQFVLVVNSDSKVERVEVSVAKTISGWAVIEQGLTNDTRVVIEGLQRARPGLEVTPMDKKLEVSDQALMRGFSSSDRAPDAASDGDSTSPSEVE